MPLLRVYMDDPDATVCVLPSDQYVEHEDLLRGYLERAFELAENGGGAVLLGMTPERPDPDYGWIVPGPEENGAKRVVRFVEKPDPDLARSLFRERASWSSLMLAAKAEVLLEMFRRWAPRVTSIMARTLAQRGWDPEALLELYAALDPLDFSRDILERTARQLRVLVVPPCGWTDLGTPERLTVWMAPRFQWGPQGTLMPILAGSL